MPSEYVLTLSPARAASPSRSRLSSIRPRAARQRAAAHPPRARLGPGGGRAAPKPPPGAGRWLGKSQQQPDQRRLARAVGPDNAERATAWNLKIDTVKRHPRPKPLRSEEHTSE